MLATLIMLLLNKLFNQILIVNLTYHVSYIFFVFIIFILFLKYKIVNLVYRFFLVSFAQGGSGVTCSPLLCILGAILSRLTALPVVVGGVGRVYAWDWDVVGGGLLF